MSNDGDDPEVTREGLFGELLGRAKEKAGEVIGNDHLIDEGRLEQAMAEAQAEALGAEETASEHEAHPEQQNSDSPSSADEDDPGV